MLGIYIEPFIFEVQCSDSNLYDFFVRWKLAGCFYFSFTGGGGECEEHTGSRARVGAGMSQGQGGNGAGHFVGRY